MLNHQILEFLQRLVWGPWILFILMGIGVFYSVRLGFLQVVHLPRALKFVFKLDGQTGKKSGDVSAFSSLCTALAATIGTGNIVGVATSIQLGGPGALFWMWVAAFLGMTTKYAECLLGFKYRQEDGQGRMSGGPMYYLEKGAKSPWLARLFALFGVFVACLGIGTFAQVNAISDALTLNFAVGKVECACAIALCVGLSIIGGIQTISRVAAAIVPLMAVVYVFAAIVLVGIHGHLVPQALSLIVGSAFSPNAIGGGLFGVSVLALQTGVARGVFSNEAGLGSAAIAAAAARSDSCVEQGLISMTGTFFDTLIVCTMTGLVLVISGLYTGEASGVSLTMAAFSLPPLYESGAWIVSIGLIFFAFTTILGWNYYGERCLVYLFGVKAIVPYRLLFVGLIAMGAFLQLENIWLLADIVNGLMIIPNVIGLFLLRHVVIKETRQYFRGHTQAGERVSVE